MKNDRNYTVTHGSNGYVVIYPIGNNSAHFSILGFAKNINKTKEELK